MLTAARRRQDKGWVLVGGTDGAQDEAQGQAQGQNKATPLREDEDAYRSLTAAGAEGDWAQAILTDVRRTYGMRAPHRRSVHEDDGEAGDAEEEDAVYEAAKLRKQRVRGAAARAGLS